MTRRHHLPVPVSPARQLRPLEVTGVVSCLVASVLACVDPAPEPPLVFDEGVEDMRGDLVEDEPLPDGERYLVRDCTFEVPLPTDWPLEPWHRLDSELASRLAPRHVLRDALTTRASSTSILARLSYGALEQEIEGEWAELYIHDCERGYRLMSRALTDARGMVNFQLNQQDIPAFGEYALRVRVVGDNTTAAARLRVLPTGSRLVVFGFDEVLTTDRLSLYEDRFVELFEPIGAGDYVPAAREGAARATQRRRAQGYEVLYLSARPLSLTSRSGAWLEQGEFAPGTLWLAESRVAPAAVSAYMKSALDRWRRQGFLLDVAYGATDEELDAYRTMEVPAMQRFMLGDWPDSRDYVSLGESYLEHVEALEQAPDVAQPFTRESRP